MSLVPQSELQELLRAGLAHHQNGSLEAAADCYQRVLAIDPHRFDALRLLGLLFHTAGHHDKALHHLQRAAAIRPMSADVWNDLGLVCYSLKDLEEAAGFLSRSIQLSPDFSEAHYNLGNVHRASGKIAQARACYKQALALREQFPEASYNLALLEQEQNNFEDAITNYSHAISCRNNYPEAWLNLGLCHSAFDDIVRAEECFQNAIRFREHYAEAWLSLGVARRKQGDSSGARTSFETVLKLDPAAIPAYLNLAMLVMEGNEHELALRLATTAIEADPKNVDAHVCLAAIHSSMGNLETAISICKTAVQIDWHCSNAHRELALLYLSTNQYENARKHCWMVLSAHPNDAISLGTLGVVESKQGSPSAALEFFETAFSIAPTDASLELNLAVSQLLLGKFDTGWKHFEARWHSKTSTCKARTFLEPLWQGADLAGKTILIHSEQGYGDTIQFVRYAQAIAARNGRVIVECPESLSRLIKTAPGVEEVINCGDPWPAVDFQIPIMSLARVFQTTLDTIPDPSPYLSVSNSAAIQLPVLDSKHLRLGIVWAGNPAHPNDRNRSIPVDRLQPLLQMPGIAFYSLQLGVEAGRLLNLGGSAPVFDLSSQLKDFSATAAAVSQMDLVLTVDTSLAHLAGALALKTWILLPLIPDWRWLLNRNDSPWYRTVRLFRQSHAGDWQIPLQSVATELLSELRAISSDRGSLNREA